jgi:hypothetical protein
MNLVVERARERFFLRIFWTDASVHRIPKKTVSFFFSSSIMLFDGGVVQVNHCFLESPNWIKFRVSHALLARLTTKYGQASMNFLVPKESHFPSNRTII